MAATGMNGLMAVNHTKPQGAIPTSSPCINRAMSANPNRLLEKGDPKFRSILWGDNKNVSFIRLLDIYLCHILSNFFVLFIFL